MKQRAMTLLVVLMVVASGVTVVGLTSVTKVKAAEKTEVTLSVPASAKTGQEYKVTGQVLIYPSSGVGSLGTGAVQLMRGSPGSEWANWKTVEIDANGGFEAADMVDRAGTYYYIARYPGNFVWASSQSAVQSIVITPADEGGMPTPTPSGNSYDVVPAVQVPYIPYINEGGSSPDASGGSESSWLWLLAIVIIILLAAIVVVLLVTRRRPRDNR